MDTMAKNVKSEYGRAYGVECEHGTQDHEEQRDHGGLARKSSVTKYQAASTLAIADAKAGARSSRGERRS